MKNVRVLHDGDWEQHVALRRRRRPVGSVGRIDAFNNALRVCVQRWRRIPKMARRLLGPLLVVNITIYILWQVPRQQVCIPLCLSSCQVRFKHFPTYYSISKARMVQGTMQRHFIFRVPHASWASSVASALWATCSHRERGHLIANGIAMLSLIPAAIEVSPTLLYALRTRGTLPSTYDKLMMPGSSPNLSISRSQACLREDVLQRTPQKCNILRRPNLHAGSWGYPLYYVPCDCRHSLIILGLCPADGCWRLSHTAVAHSQLLRCLRNNLQPDCHGHNALPR